MSEALYLNDDRTTDRAKVLSCEPTENGLWAVRLDHTIFHPQGGGQPSDVGTINGVDVIKALHTPEGIVHLIASPVDGDVELQIDAEKRLLHTRLHSAGHIIGFVGDQLGWHATKGNHFPGESRVTFEPPAPDEIELIEPSIFEEKVNRIISMNLPRVITERDGLRMVTWGGLRAYPCGGTHVRNTTEIGAVHISKIKLKKGQITVSYSLA